jgi:two-component system response regulator PilR (NtrC family)
MKMPTVDSARNVLTFPACTAVRETKPHPLERFGCLYGSSPAMQAVYRKIEKVSPSAVSVLIVGESGSGKELVANTIHQMSERAGGPFVPVNCGAIPQELIESELFGHVKGSFTGAIADNPGLFQAAKGGTLFLDEVADIPLPMQVKLLRAIQEKSIRPVGAQREVRSDVRLLSATHKDLGALVQEGRFRQDLYYRINVIEITVPPLRERTGDIEELALHILGRLGEEAGVERPAISEAAMGALREYPFPGNVRELENILERAFTLCEDNCIGVEDLGIRPPAERDGALADAELDATLESIERERILAALEQTRWNKTAAAKRLGISFRALRYRLKKLELE